MFWHLLAVMVLVLVTQAPAVPEKAGRDRESYQPFESLVRKVAIIGSKRKLPETFIDYFHLPGAADDLWYQVTIPIDSKTRRTACVPVNFNAKHFDIVLTRKLEQGTCSLKTSKQGKLESSALADREGISEVNEAEELFSTERKFWLAWVEKPSFLCQVKKVDAEKHLIVVTVGRDKAAEKRSLLLKVKDDLKVIGNADGL